MPEFPELPRRIFGKLERTEAAARRKIGLAYTHGWMDFEVKQVERGGLTLYALEGHPAMQFLQAMHGTKPDVNAPRVVDSRRRKGQAYRHRGHSP